MFKYNLFRYRYCWERGIQSASYPKMAEDIGPEGRKILFVQSHPWDEI